MSFAEFQSVAAPPKAWSGALQALWHDAKGNWDRAHECAQEDGSRAGAWVHAYLHRKEGDAGNAAYWYARAAREMPAESVALEDELKQIVSDLLK